MKKVILIDGNNLLFRSYYATAYAGNMMNNSKGFPTNALFGFVNMMNKIIKEEKPEYILVALDKGKTFRHEKYDFYKDGRGETPDELKIQFPKAKEILSAMGIKYLEVDNYEADDIIGTVCRMLEEDEDFDGTIISSDKDLLQLISDEIDVKLLKSKDHIRMDRDVFFDTYGIEPIKMIDLKALMGDPSDNIPGVKGVGEKTALKLLVEYGSLDGVYNNIDNISGKLKEKLVNDKEKAYISYEMATIVKDAPVDIEFEEFEFNSFNEKELVEIYEELEFYSFLKNMNRNDESKIKESEVIIVNSLEDLKLNGPVSVYFDVFGDNYHKGKLRNIALYDGTVGYYVDNKLIDDVLEYIDGLPKYVYDNKKYKYICKYKNYSLNNVEFDLLLASYILEYNIKDDIAYLANQFNYVIPFAEEIYNKENKLLIDEEKYIKIMIDKAKFIFEIKDEIINKLKDEEQYDLYKNIELPLSNVLMDMEYSGVLINKDYLSKMGEEVKIKLSIIEQDIYNMAGEEFNILSTQQLSKILFEKLGLKTGKKTKTGYSTKYEVLVRLRDKHPIINQILDYRTLSKLYSNYIDGLISLIYEDGKIHPIYNQTLTRTGRLSASEPNIQNIPIKENYGRLIRKAFIPSDGNIMISFDYSQIELRILAHMSGAENLIEAFNNDIDIHTKTASDIFGVDIRGVTKDMRSKAKAVNFGIIYGISSFGLSEQINMDIGEAKKFIDLYLETFPGIKIFQEKLKSDAYKNGYVTTLMNRKRTVPELNNKNYMIRNTGERMALNAPIQGTSADIIKKAMVEIFDKFEKENMKSNMIIQVHDELIFDVIPSEKDKLIDIVTDIMENTYKLNVPLKVEIEVGNNWYEAK